MNHGAREMQSMPMMGDVDYDFVMAMKTHHEDAVAMANVVLKYGKDARVRQFARKIIDSQTKEIGELDQWMSEHPQGMTSPPLRTDESGGVNRHDVWIGVAFPFVGA